jgi:uncharacterized protein
MSNAINWFEIPVRDLDRAERFYAEMLDRPLQRTVFGGVEHAIFSASETGVGGALVRDSRRKPHADGALVYLATSDIEASLKRAQASGGETLLPRTDISPHGFIGIVRDSEGNTVGLHSPT